MSVNLNLTCKHFGFCGGCSIADKPYDEQLKTKTQAVQNLLAPFYDGDLPITPSPAAQFYRNKIELSFCNQVVWKLPPHGGKQKIVRDKSAPLEFEKALGFRVKGRWDRCVDLQECFLFNPQLPAFLKEVRAWAADKNLMPCSMTIIESWKKHRKFWRL